MRAVRRLTSCRCGVWRKNHRGAFQCLAVTGHELASLVLRLGNVAVGGSYFGARRCLAMFASMEVMAFWVTVMGRVEFVAKAMRLLNGGLVISRAQKR